MAADTTLFNNINWADLREQKLALLRLANEREDTYVPKSFEEAKQHDTDIAMLDGVIHLLDAIQDCAVDELGISEKTVFNL